MEDLHGADEALAPAVAGHQQVLPFERTAQPSGLTRMRSYAKYGAGKIDRIGRQLILITAWHDQTKLGSTHPDEDLKFEIPVEKQVTHLILEVSGGGIYYKVYGPWDKDTDTIIDLETGLFTVKGFVKNQDGTPEKRVLVSAHDETGAQIAYRYTSSKGQFTFFTRFDFD